MMARQSGVGTVAERRSRAVLIYAENGLEREVAVERSPFTIGRLPDRDLVLNAPFVSRQHAEIVQRGDDFVLCDLGSKAGSFVNGGHVHRHTLRAGDVIQIGSLEAPQIEFKRQGDTTNLPLQT